MNFSLLALALSGFVVVKQTNAACCDKPNGEYAYPDFSALLHKLGLPSAFSQQSPDLTAFTTQAASPSYSTCSKPTTRTNKKPDIKISFPSQKKFSLSKSCPCQQCVSRPAWLSYLSPPAPSSVASAPTRTEALPASNAGLSGLNFNPALLQALLSGITATSAPCPCSCGCS